MNFAALSKHTLMTPPLRADCLLPMLLTGLCLLLAMNPILGAQIERNDTIIVGGDYNYPPYEFLDENGSPTGYNVALTRAIADVMGINIEIRLGRWSDIREDLRQGRVDVLQGMVHSAERDKYFDFSPPHAVIRQSVFGRRDEPEIATLDQLQGKSVIVQQSGIMHDLLLQRGIDAQLVLVDTHAAALRLLASGKHDYALVANLPGLYLERELELSNITPVFNLPEGQRYGFAVREGDSDLLAQFSEGLAILKNTQRHKQIYDAWLGVLESGLLRWETIGWLAGIASLILLLTLGITIIWNRTLSRKVQERTQELELRQRQLIQADKMASLGILVSGMAHEINNPNSLLLMNLPLLESAFEDSRQALDEYHSKHHDFALADIAYTRMRREIPMMLVEMYEGAQRIKRIVEDLKDFSRQGSANLDEHVDLNAITKTALRLVDNSIRKATRNFEAVYDPNLPGLKGNTQRIEQVIVNLVLNACQALENREQGIRIRTYSDPEMNKAVLEVSDEGRGIEADLLPQLINPFYTTKRALGGTGLGLSVSAGIIQEHQGSMDFESTPGSGTTVTVTLPLKRR